jgi:hypothetical protein
MHGNGTRSLASPGNNHRQLYRSGSPGIGVKASPATWMCLLLTVPSLALGAYMLSAQDVGLMWLLRVLVLSIVVLAAWTTVKWSRDVLNPLWLVLFIVTVRYFLPIAFLRDAPLQPLLRFMNLSPTEWALGEVLALVGVAGVCAGWSIPWSSESLAMPRFRLAPHVVTPAVLASGIGFFALVWFVRVNVPVTEAVVQGSFRGTVVQQGTGVFFYLSLILISSSVLLSGWLLWTKRGALIVLSPVILTGIFYLVLGGRARAMVAPIAGGVLLWYRVFARRERQWHLSTGRLLKIGAAALLVLWIAYAGSLYRTVGIRGFGQALSFDRFATSYSFVALNDLGQLHALAVLTRLEPGVLEGKTFISLLWPLSDLLDLGGRSAGVFTVEQTIGFYDERWGFHSSLIGDAYLNFGVAGLVAIMLMAGAALKAIYIRFLQGRMHAVVYSLALIYSMRIVFESIDKWGEALLVVGVAAVLVWFGRFAGNADPAVPAVRNRGDVAAQRL